MADEAISFPPAKSQSIMHVLCKIIKIEAGDSFELWPSAGQLYFVGSSIREEVYQPSRLVSY